MRLCLQSVFVYPTWTLLLSLRVAFSLRSEYFFAIQAILKQPKGAFFWHQQMLLAEIWCDVTPIDVDKYGNGISSATRRVRKPSTSKVFDTNFPSNTTSAHKRWRLCLDKRICICLICKWTACCLPPRETTLHL